MSRAQMQGYFGSLHPGGSGGIAREEWTQKFTDLYGGTTAQAHKLFDYLDKTGEKVICAQTFDNLFTDMDDDRSGDVSKEEFYKFWMKLLA